MACGSCGKSKKKTSARSLTGKNVGLTKQKGGQKRNVGFAPMANPPKVRKKVRILG